MYDKATILRQAFLAIDAINEPEQDDNLDRYEEATDRAIATVLNDIGMFGFSKKELLTAKLDSNNDLVFREQEGRNWYLFPLQIANYLSVKPIDGRAYFIDKEGMWVIASPSAPHEHENSLYFDIVIMPDRIPNHLQPIGEYIIYVLAEIIAVSRSADSVARQVILKQKQDAMIACKNWIARQEVKTVSPTGGGIPYPETGGEHIGIY